MIINLKAFNQYMKTLLYSLESLQYEFNAHWKCLYKFLNDNNFDIEENYTYVLKEEEYNFLKKHFTNKNCQKKDICLDLRARISSTTVPKIIEYLKEAELYNDIKIDGTILKELDFKMYQLVFRALINVNSIPLDKIKNEIRKEIEYFDSKQNKTNHLDDDQDYDSHNQDALGPNLYNIAMRGYNHRWSCSLCDGDSESGCQLSDSSGCIRR